VSAIWQPSVTQAAVNECPEPTARTVCPALAAIPIASASCCSSAGRTTLAGEHDCLGKLGGEEGIAAQVGQIDDLLLVDHLAGGGVGYQQERRLGNDVDLLAYLADYQFEVDGDGGLGGYYDAVPFQALEAGRLRADGVGGRRDGGEDELADFVDCRGAADLGAFIGKGKLGQGYGGIRWVPDLPT